MEELISLIPRLTGKRIVIVGDLCLDEYIIGRARRLSREAPVPVLEFQSRFTLPGAAANPALNICSLGGEAAVVGVIGEDEAGLTLRQELEERGIDTSGLVVDPQRPTTLKTRVLAEVSLHFPQQMIRVDRQPRDQITTQTMEKLIASLSKAATQADAILLSDYKAGVVAGALIPTALSLARASGKLITVDSQGDLFKFKGFDAIKCNREEAEAILGRELAQEESFRRLGRQLQRRLAAQALLITRGSDGMSLIQAGSKYLHLPAANRSEVFDVTGAGDTVIAVFTLAVTAGASLQQAAHLANYAAGLVVRKLGNATTSPAELGRAILEAS